MADISVTAANVAPSTTTVKASGVAGETITAGQPVALNATTKKLVKADSNAATEDLRKPVGIALNGASANQPLTYAKSGPITSGATMTAGLAYYLSDTAGGICPVADIGSGEYVCLLGIAASTTVLNIDIQYPGVSL